MTREQAINAYGRVREWEQRQSEMLRQTILVPVFSGDLCCQHNWMLNFERDGSCITREEYKLGKFYNWKQRQVWDTATRLQSAFAKHF